MTRWLEGFERDCFQESRGASGRITHDLFFLCVGWGVVVAFRCLFVAQCVFPPRIFRLVLLVWLFLSLAQRNVKSSPTGKGFRGSTVSPPVMSLSANLFCLFGVIPGRLVQLS